jgi:pimeloyl-ACP methyl ester carboxylesterase
MATPSWRLRPTLLRGLVGIALCWSIAGVAGTLPASAAAPAVGTPTGDPSFRCTQLPRKGDEVATLETTLAGVPAILRVPRQVTRSPIVLWHGFGAPASARALMEAMPLDDVAAVKVYLGLPLFGTRAPAGGNQELARRQTQDFAMLLFKPAVVGAADELPSVVAALEQHGCMTSGQRIDLFGFSAGGTAALVALMQGKVAVGAAVLLNASTGLNASVDAWQRALGKVYPWTPASRALAEETDAVGHAADVARGKTPPAILILQGEGDTVLTTAPAMALHQALLPIYRRKHDEARLGMVVLPGMPHSWIDDKTAAVEVRHDVAAWLARH